MKVLRWLWAQLFPLFVVLWVNGVLLRITVRDSVPMFAALYYATPWPVLVALTFPIIWRFRRVPQMVFGTIVIAHVFLAMWIMEDWRSGQPSSDPADMRIVQWNLARPVHRFPGIAKIMHGFDADVITVAEALPYSGKGRERWKSEYPDYKVEFAPGNIVSLVRGDVLARQVGLLGPSSYYALYELRIKGHELRLLQVDLNGMPTSSRREPLLHLANLVESLTDRPLIIAGDFNTPRDSVYFGELRKGLVNTFEKVGIGSGETWPMPLPVLSLDQIWCNPRVIPVRCHHEISFRSDHRAVVAEVRFTE